MRFGSVIVAVLLLLSLLFVQKEASAFWGKKEKMTEELKGKKKVMIIAGKDFRDEELNVPMAQFKKNGAQVTVASSSMSESKGMLGAKAKPDMLFIDIRPGEFDAVIFVGGSGATEYWDNPIAHKIARGAVNSNKVLGAICIAPVTLAKAGLLGGKTATVWESEAKQLSIAGAKYTGNAVEVDGKIVTANGPKAAKEFAQAIMDLLK